ncbi:hypothetical protein H632_c292p1 [Helicosporidium sp. ATCC 50920]|nr:hypothetical protein H632_c292p1 [Helicosporidium sp. ATCC 50920]|eukprot:KDD76265.1 hypothetical protein H632_c292p1 [Helicosporidium sp. ATCC 50920]
MVGRPTDLEQLREMVLAFPKVKASGVGGSWWAEQFCSGWTSDSINIVMTELVPVLNAIQFPPSLVPGPPTRPFPDFPIEVDETAATVRVLAGIPQRVLLDYLATYTLGREPLGWTLPAFSWFIDQTIGGAVSTGTHGSTLRFGSLSSQLVSMRVLLANGTTLDVSPASHPHHFRALGVSVGRLGIITDLTLRIRPQAMITRRVDTISSETFTRQLERVQSNYVAALQQEAAQGRPAQVQVASAAAAPASSLVEQALFELHETQAFWNVETGDVHRIAFSYPTKRPLDVKANVFLNTTPDTVVAFAGPQSDSGVYRQDLPRPLKAHDTMKNDPALWGAFYNLGARPYLTSGTFEARRAYMSASEYTNRAMSNMAPYAQYEVSVPLETAGSCMRLVRDRIYGRQRLSEGFRNLGLVRFVSGEEFYLSNTHGGPRMYINIEDYLTLSGTRNDKFFEVIRLFREECGARFHWGKAGWPQFASCFDGATEYPDTWCHFGCAVSELDPKGKFAGAGQGATNVWTWSATKNGQEVPFESCCSSSGFSSSCKCAPRKPCAA